MPRPAAAFLVAAAMLAAACQQWWWGDVPYIPTPREVVDRMLRMARVGPGDIVYDLGSGDGRIVIAAVRDFHAAKGVGVDIDDALIRQSIENAEAAGVGDRTTFIRQDIFKTDFSEASVITMFLLREINLRLRPRILGLRPGTRIVSHRFDMGDWQPDERSLVDGRSVYLWIVPAKVEGTWRWSLDGREMQIALAQSYQRIEGVLHTADERAPARLEAATLTGDRLRFTAQVERNGQSLVMRFDGRAKGDELRGNLTVGGRLTRIVAMRER